MKPESLFSTLLFVLFLVFESRGQTTPNVIYLNADDLGVQDVGFMGGKLYRTPNLDSLVAEGMTFSDGYAPSANCAPSRAAFFYDFFGFGPRVTDFEFFWYFAQDGTVWTAEPYFHFLGGKVKN
jgi:hypothetical protein